MHLPTSADTGAGAFNTSGALIVGRHSRYLELPVPGRMPKRLWDAVESGHELLLATMHTDHPDWSLPA
ncbi:hypothetical protein, partial [Xanthomonas arboricola]|uniref:hypothetical protein n=1 Tax=Xanthomonas arboricola TaxID=56448 RepID=UPI0019D708AF